jgi:hypothetical protein
MIEIKFELQLNCSINFCGDLLGLSQAGLREETCGWRLPPYCAIILGTSGYVGLIKRV